LAAPVRFEKGAFPMLEARRRIDGRDFFWLANNSDSWQTCDIAVAGVHGAASIWDCETGEIRSAASTDAEGGGRLTLLFKPFEAYWLVFDPSQAARSGPPAMKPEFEVVTDLTGTWQVVFDASIQPVMEYPLTPPAAFAAGTPKALGDWKDWGLEKFSGLLDYVKTINLDNPGTALKLDLGKVCHIAEVWINGRDCGARLWGPYVFDVGGALHAGPNEIRVRVGNLINNSYGEKAESGLIGPIRLVRETVHRP